MADELEVMENQEEVDPWAAAFAKLNAKDTGDEAGDNQPSPDADPAGWEEQQPEPEPGAGGEPADDIERPAVTPEVLPGEAGVEPEPDPDVTSPEVEAAINEYQSQARQAAIDTVVEAYKKQGVRVTPDGKLGASMQDPDVCKRDADGTVRYYNPETGREFTGPNPRADARAWVDEYNRELADQFNAACAKVERQKMGEYEPAIQVLKFAPKYDALDDMTRGLLDDIIEPYEVKDSSGNLIGYSCDLNAALNVAKKQMARFKDYTKPEPKPATGPEEDMKKGSAKGNSQPEGKFVPKSLEEAMAYLQDQEVEKRNKKGRK